MISQATHVKLHSLGCRLWVEWIDSESNVSDGLSRLGVLDPWTRDRHWQLRDFPFPPELERECLLRLLGVLWVWDRCPKFVNFDPMLYSR